MPENQETRVLITGPAGSGKTHAALKEVLASPKALLLLPTFGQVEHIKRRSLRFLGTDAAFDPPFLTFTGLYERLFPGRRIRHLASAVERQRLMERAIRSADLPVFRGVAETPGFVHRALAVVKEMRESDLSGAEIREAVESEYSGDGTTPDRILGFLEIARRYEEGLDTADLTDHEGALKETLEALRAGAGEDLERIAADGFSNFTRVEFRILEALVERARRAIVTLPRDPARGSGLFRISAATRDALLAMGFVEKPLGRNRRAECAALRHVSTHLFGTAIRRQPSDGRVLRIIGADRASEVDQIAREIDRIRRGKVLRVGSPPPDLREIGVVLRRLEPYRDLIPSTFARHRIPVRLVQDRLPLRSEPIVRHALGLIAAVSGNFDGPDLVRAIRSAHLRAGPGLRGAAESLAEEIRERGGPRTLEELLAGDRGPLRGFLGPLAASLEGTLPCRAMARRLERVVLDGIAPSFEGRGGDPGRDGEFWHARYREESAALLRVIESIREAGSEHLWEEPGNVRARDLARGVMDAILEDSVVIRDRRLNCVNVIDAQEARQWDSLRIVFVAGLLEKEFPIYPREDVFLRDLERKRLNERTALSLKENLRQREEERYLFYVAATRARDLLYLSHPAHDVDGKELQPSFYVDDLMGLFRDRDDLVRRASLAEPCPPPEEASSAADLEVAVARALGGTPEALEEALYRTAPDPSIFPRRMRYLRSGGSPIESGDLRSAILESSRSLSASRINRFLQCPRLYFILITVAPRGPRPSLEERLGWQEIGSIAHRVLERHLREDPPASLEDLIEEEIGRKLEGVDLGIERDLVVRNLRSDLLWAMGRQLETPGPFRPWKFEHRFRGVEVPAGDHPVRLRGSIDRIDAGEVEGERYAVLVDYKLSRGFSEEHRTAVLEPTDVQLPVYALAVRRTLGIPVAGAEFFPIRKPGRGGIYREDLSDALRGRWESKESLFVSPEAFEEILDRAEETIGDAVQRIRDGEVGRTPLDPAECREGSCEAFHICRPDRWALMEGRGT